MKYTWQKIAKKFPKFEHALRTICFLSRESLISNVKILFSGERFESSGIPVFHEAYPIFLSRDNGES